MGWINRLLGIVLREKSFGQRRKFGQVGGKFSPLGAPNDFSRSSRTSNATAHYTEEPFIRNTILQNVVFYA